MTARTVEVVQVVLSEEETAAQPNIEPEEHLVAVEIEEMVLSVKEEFGADVSTTGVPTTDGPTIDDLAVVVMEDQCTLFTPNPDMTKVAD